MGDEYIDWSLQDPSWTTDDSMSWMNDADFANWLSSQQSPYGYDMGIEANNYANYAPTFDFNPSFAGTDVGGTGTFGGMSQPGTGFNWGSLGGFLTSPQGVGTMANIAGGYLNQQNYLDAAKQSADAQIRAAQIAAEAQKFKPVGVTTNFGSSKFTTDAQGNLTGAGYTLTPQMQAMQNQIMGSAGGMLNQFTGSQAATEPMGTGANRMMALGNQYLATDPQAQAQKYYNDQQTVLSASRAKAMADLQATMQAQGRGGFAIGGDAGMGAANPQLQALLNAQLQQDRELAAQATQGGMDYAKFGAGMLGGGGEMLKNMYGTQTAAYSPFATALQGAGYIEGLGQNALDIGTKLGSSVTAGNQSAGQLLGQGMTNAANTQMQGQQGAGSLWGSLLQGAAPAIANYKWGT